MLILLMVLAIAPPADAGILRGLARGAGKIVSVVCAPASIAVKRLAMAEYASRGDWRMVGIISGDR